MSQFHNQAMEQSTHQIVDRTTNLQY